MISYEQRQVIANVENLTRALAWIEVMLRKEDLPYLKEVLDQYRLDVGNDEDEIAYKNILNSFESYAKLILKQED